MEMDLRLLERSPDVMPLLVQLYDSQKLDSLARSDTKEARVELTSVMTDLLQIELSPTEQELITDVLIGLMRQAEIDLRKALADRLAVMDDIPLRMVLHLASDEPIVADSILRESPVLQDMDLIYIIQSQGPAHWQSIARRKFINGQVVDMLADTKDLDTAIALTENQTATLTENAVQIFAEMAQHSQALAKPLLTRQELPKGIARTLYKAVGDALKTTLRYEYGYHADNIADELSDVVLEFEEADNTSYMPSTRQIQSAQTMHKKGTLDVDSMMRMLRRGQIASFIAQFSVFSGMAPQTVHDVLEQNKGQGLAIACKALEITKTDFMSFFLLTGKMRGEKDSVVNQFELGEALSFFERVSPDQAKRILDSSKD